MSTASRPARRERELLTTDLGDAFFRLQQQLRREVAERNDHARFDELELTIEPGRAGLDLVRLRIAVAGRTTLHDVRDVHVGPRQPDAFDELRKQLAGPADEGLTFQILLLARSFAHEHQIGIGAAHTEDHLRTPAREFAQGAGERGGSDVGEQRTRGARGVRIRCHEAPRGPTERAAMLARRRPDRFGHHVGRNRPQSIQLSSPLAGRNDHREITVETRVRRAQRLREAVVSTLRNEEAFGWVELGIGDHDHEGRVRTGLPRRAPGSGTPRHPVAQCCPR